MDCRAFRRKHLAFIDDTLPGIELVAMQRHLLECEACARHDTEIRRGLMLFRSLPRIEPSPDFAERLNARLREERLAAAAGLREPVHRGPGLKTFMVAAVAVVAIGYLATAAYDWVSPQPELALAPVVADHPEPLPSAVVDPVLTASVSTGMSLWPAVLMAEQAPIHFVRAAAR